MTEREQIIAWLRWQAESAAEDATIPKAVWWTLNFAASTIERGDHALAQVGRNPAGEDLQGLRAEHEHAVGEADAPTLSAAPRSNPPTDGTGNKPSEQE